MVGVMHRGESFEVLVPPGARDGGGEPDEIHGTIRITTRTGGTGRDARSNARQRLGAQLPVWGVGSESIR